MVIYNGVREVETMNDNLLTEKNDIEKELIKLDSKYSKVAGFRLVVFLIAVILIALGASNHSVIYMMLGIVFVIGFVFLVRYHSLIKENISSIKAKSKVLGRYLKRKSGEWRSFKDDGSEYLKPNDNLSHDLDLLGRASLFQMISIAHTSAGREKLANTLSLKNVKLEDRSKRYEAVQELSEKVSFLVDFEASSERILEKREKEKERLGEEEKETPEKDVKKLPLWMYPLMILVPVINIAAIILVLVGGQTPTRILIAFILGLVITWFPMGILDSIISPVYKYGIASNDYHRMLKLISDSEFKSEVLKNIYDRTTSRDGILSAIRSMGRISAVNNISFNPIIHMVLAGFLGWDYYIALAASRWAAKNEGVFEECTDIISDIEELGSIAVLSMVRDTTEPEIIGTMKLDMTKVYHPLLNPETVVSNDAVIDNKLTIITGSNMSGKTTYLRTVAINMVLSYIGAGVCAESFKVPYMNIFTSMRVMDDVAGGISTFYAEILRIKEMAEYISSDASVPAICLIDEIFKGTNSADRIVGATEALQKLSAGNSMVLVSTHDFELCDLSENNYHFEEYYENGELKFDYKMRDGKCTTRNAIAILKMAGLVQN